MSHELTSQELAALETGKTFWNDIIKLPVEHPDDLNELRFHFHAMQNIIAARPVFRELNAIDNNAGQPTAK